MTFRLLVLGAGGMLGHKLCQVASGALLAGRDPLGRTDSDRSELDRGERPERSAGEGADRGDGQPRWQVWGACRNGAAELARRQILPADRLIEGVEASDFDSLTRAFAQVRPDAVVNCVGVIKQLAAAQDPIVTLSLNSLFPHRLANLCRASGARLIHVSTDCCFSGRKGRYVESDVCDAEDLYGRTKHLGEVAGPGCLTLRTSIIGRELRTASGLVEWFLGRAGQRVAGYTRAIYTGFTTLAFSRVVLDLLDRHPGLEGLYQVSSEPISKYELLRLIDAVYRTQTQIEPDRDFACDRSLDSTRFRTATGFRPDSWSAMIQQMHDDPTPYDSGRRPSRL